MNNEFSLLSSKSKDAYWALAVFSALGLLFFYPVLLGYLISQSDYLYFVSPWTAVRPDDLLAPSNPYLQDQSTEFLAFFMAAKTQILQGMWPLWNPYILSGTPLLANTQSALLFPLNWGHFLLPVGWGFTVSALLKVILTPWFTYVFARRIKLSHSAALLAGVSYGFCSFHVFWLNHPHSNVTLLIPLCFYACENLVTRQGIRQVVLLAAVTAMTLFAGHVEIAFYTAIGCAIYVLVRALQLKQVKISLALQFMGAYIGSLLLAAVLIVPFLEFLTVAAVWEERSTDLVYTMPISAMATAIFADIFTVPGWIDDYLGYHISSLYIGVAALPLLLIGVIYGLKQAWPWLVVLLVTMMLAFDLGPLYDGVKQLPLMGHLPMFYWAALMAFAGALLAALGWQCCLDNKPGKLSLCLVAIIMAIIVWGIVLFWTGADYGAAVASVYQLRDAIQHRAFIITAVLLSLVFVMYWAGSRAHWMSSLVMVLLFADLWWFNHAWNPGVSPQRVFPQRTPASIQFLQQQPGPFRILGLNHILKPSTNMLVELEEVRGYDVPVNQRYHRFFKQALTGTVSYWVYDKASYDVALLPYLNIQNVHYILSKTTLDASAKLSLVYDDEIKIYKNQAAEERLYFRRDAQFVETSDSALAELLAEPKGLSQQVIIESDQPVKPISIDSGSETSTGFSVEIVAYNAQKITAEVVAPESGWLIHATAYYPGWRAYVDGEQVPLYPANYTQQGIHLSAGKHRVSFRYEPLSFKIGLLLTLLSFTGVLWILIKNKK